MDCGGFDDFLSIDWLRQIEELEQKRKDAQEEADRLSEEEKRKAYERAMDIIRYR